jgi:hypothetical protein
VRASIEVTRAELRVLPRYSPDFTSNYSTFSELKAFFNITATRIVDALYNAIAQSIDTYTPMKLGKLIRCCRLWP